MTSKSLEIPPPPSPELQMWEDDPFDNLKTGALSGQNGWVALQDSPQVVIESGRGKVLHVDPDDGRTIAVGKRVEPQVEGTHVFEFDVKVDGAREPSLAKIELQTSPNAGWDKKFQIYFGTSMRVGYDPDGAAETIVTATQPSHWYQIRMNLDLDLERLDVWVDGAKAAAGIPMHPGPITGLAISGWDRPGEVHLDSLKGYRPSWEYDDFDALAPGPLQGQNGWQALRDSAIVVPHAGLGNVLEVDPGNSRTIVVTKDVPDQDARHHTFEFDVRVDGAVEASLAKIELKTTTGRGWDRKFQLYFGSSIRVNYSAQGDSQIIVPTTELGRWYHIRCDMDLSGEDLTVSVDGRKVAAGLPMHSGPITALAISGWDRTGKVLLDKLHGFERQSSLGVQIVSPSHGATAKGTVEVEARGSEDVVRVEFYVDGVLQVTDDQAPFNFAWDTWLNPLAVPNHPIDYGYYFVEWKNPADFDTRRAEVNDYTNEYFASRFSYLADLSPAEWRPLLAQSLANAHREGKRTHLALWGEGLWDDILDVAAPYWNDVVRLEIDDEPRLSLVETEAMIQRLKAKLSNRGLAHRPMGSVYVHDEPLPDAINAPSLDWVGIEAYLDSPGSPLSQANIDALTAFLLQEMARVPADKDIVLVMMAYDRNGAWPNIDTLRDLQIPVYLRALDDPRVVAINLFAYSRAGGSRDHPELRTPHRLIGERILRTSLPLAGNGPRTLSVVGYDKNGFTTFDRVVVVVANPDQPPPHRR